MVFYRRCGEGPAVVLCDGIGCDGFIWKYLIPALVRHHTLFHPHLRGHGRSPPPPEPDRVSIDALADDLFEVLDDAGVDSAVLVGHSMGVQTCLEAFRRHGDRVVGLVLTCGSHGSPLRTFYGTDLFHHLLPLLQAAVRGALRWPARLIWSRLLPSSIALDVALTTEVNGELIRREDMETYLDHLSRVDPALFLTMLRFADQHSAADILEQIDVPVLLIEGDRDGFTPLSQSREMERRIPDASLLVVEGGTHAAPLERPALVTGAVEAFTLWLTTEERV